MYIVSRTTGGSAPTSWDLTTYPDISSRQLTPSDISIIECIGTGCFVSVTGVANGGVSNSYLAFMEGDSSPYVYIVSRSTGGSAPTSWDITTYPDISSRQLTPNDVVINNCTETGCFITITGVANGGVSNAYLAVMEGDASPYVYIVSRTTGGSTPLSWDITTYPDLPSRQITPSQIDLDLSN